MPKLFLLGGQNQYPNLNITLNRNGNEYHWKMKTLILSNSMQKKFYLGSKSVTNNNSNSCQSYNNIHCI